MTREYIVSKLSYQNIFDELLVCNSVVGTFSKCVCVILENHQKVIFAFSRGFENGTLVIMSTVSLKFNFWELALLTKIFLVGDLVLFARFLKLFFFVFDSDTINEPPFNK